MKNNITNIIEEGLVPLFQKMAKTSVDKNGSRLHFVGGMVRDALLGRGYGDDIDLSGPLTPEGFISLLDTLVEDGVIKKHSSSITEKVGTVFSNISYENYSVEVEYTPYRTEGFTVDGDGRHPDKVWFSTDINDDAVRRDFTINALYYDILAEEVVDPTGGMKDLEASILRAVGIPEQRFKEDYLRILRALRFSSKFGFKIEENTYSAMKRLSGELSKLSEMRTVKEFSKGILAGGSKYVRTLETYGRDSGVQLSNISFEDLSLISSKDPILGVFVFSKNNKSAFALATKVIASLLYDEKQYKVAYEFIFGKRSSKNVYSLETFYEHLYFNSPYHLSIEEYIGVFEIVRNLFPEKDYVDYVKFLRDKSIPFNFEGVKNETFRTEMVDFITLRLVDGDKNVKQSVYEKYFKPLIKNGL